MRRITSSELRQIMDYDPATGVFVWKRPDLFHPRLKGKPALTMQKTEKPTDDLVRGVGAEALVRNIVDDLLALSEDDRLEVFSNFCHHCGRNDPRCQCWNDD